jgi:predicted phosphodiesterase
MKFGIFSDLHLEFEPWEFTPDPDVFYLNAGDTHPYIINRHQFEAKFFNNYFAVFGNHDYYGNSFVGAATDFDSTEVTGLKIAGATLWTDIRPDRWWDFRDYMVDFREIRGLNYDRYMNAHKTHHDFLFQADADIWVIHHLPSFQSVHEKFRHSGGNDFFATELSHKILDMRKPPKLIVHGHTHEQCDYMIGDTRVICHPRGYPNEQEWYKNYQPLIVEIN